MCKLVKDFNFGKYRYKKLFNKIMNLLENIYFKMFIFFVENLKIQEYEKGSKFVLFGKGIGEFLGGL